MSCADLSKQLTHSSLDKKYDLNLPEYPGFEQVVELSPGDAKL